MKGPGDAANAAQMLPAGTRVAHYEVQGVIGTGGMGIVYGARDRKLDRDVALKCIRPDRASDPDFKRRTVREARLASRLSHPNIVRVLDVLELDGFPVIVMERIEGVSLRAILEKRGTLGVDEVLSLADDLARALAGAHERGVLHRDVNPSNILVTADGRALLTDFGLARRVTRDGDDGSVVSSLSAPDVVVGTPGYMSPEQLLGRSLDARTDIFSLGTVLYEACAGSRAFRGTSGAALIDAILNREPQALATVNATVPGELERVIRKALAKRPEDRYQSSLEMLGDVRALRGFSRPPSTLVTRPRGRVLRAGLLAGSLFVAAVLAALLVLRGGVPFRSPAESTDPVPRQLTGGPGLQTNPEISPDGSLVAYASDETGDLEIWVVDVVSGRTLRLTNDPAEDREPAWFPDGSGLAFTSDRGGQAGIWKTARLGGAPVRLLEDARDPAISPDGSTIAFARSARPGGSTRIWAAPLADVSQARRISPDEGFWDHGRPAFSPDGRTICYDNYDGLWLVPVAGGEARRVAIDELFPRQPAFSPDGSRLYFACRQNDARALWSAPVRGGTARRLTLGTGSESQPSVSRDGKRLAYATGQSERRLVLFDRATGERTELPGLRDPMFPVFAPGGSRLFFLAAPTGRQDIWSIPLRDGRPAGEPEQVTDVGDPGTFSPSPDGRWLAFHRNVKGSRDIWLVPVAGGNPFPLVESPAAEINPAWSPTGSSLAFPSDREGEFDLFLLPMNGEKAAGTPRRLTEGRGRTGFPVWSARGDLLAYVGGPETAAEAWVVDPRGGSPARPVTSGAQAYRVWFGTEPDTLLVCGAWGTGRTEIRSVRISDGAVTPLEPRLIASGEEVPGDFGAVAGGTLLAYVEHRVRGGIWVLERPGGGF